MFMVAPNGSFMGHRGSVFLLEYQTCLNNLRQEPELLWVSQMCHLVSATLARSEQRFSPKCPDLKTMPI